MHKLRVGVFMGGRSVENEASFVSGRTVCDHLDSSSYEIIPIFQRNDGALFLLPWHFLHRGKTTDFVHRLESQAQQIFWDDLKNIVDFIYLAIHGRYAEDGCLQGFLEVLGIPYLGSSILTSAICMDKDFQKYLLTAHGFNVPKSITLTPAEVAQYNETELKRKLDAAHIAPPYVVKPHKEGSSLGVTVVFEHNQLHAALLKACHIQPHESQSVLIEERIEGMEFSCITIIDKQGNLLPLPPTEIVPEAGTNFFDYEQKYMPGRAIKFTPARCSPEQIQLIQETCIRATEVFEIKTISRIDGFLTADNKVILVDPNTLCGMGPTSFLFRQAAEINMGHTALINHLIETELRAYGMLQGKL
ncbi:MAG TPA: ATP-grasp domain-containing protein [Candidatus Babeliales bacterium]|nr:ATP-grasp domain-containing protein [Candidatus Babeliales bacterium]